MGEHNQIKFGSSISRGVKRLFGLDDLEDGVTRLSETLYATAELSGRPEYLYPQNEKIWGVTSLQGATAAEFSTVGISNPAGSGFLVVVEQIHITAASEVYTIRVGANIAFAATGKPTQADLRIPGLPNASFTCNSFAHHSAAQIGTTLYQVTLSGGNVFNHYEIPIVLPPGFFMAVDRSTVNTALQVSFYGRERPANPGELLGQ